ncbi:MAG TPA: hypothetical protein VGH19_05475 [Verrucomicrobiae bacterium]
MSSGVHPVILISVIGALAALIALVFACKVKNRLGTAMLIVLAMVFITPSVFVFLAFHPELVDARFRTYKRFHSDIQVGMTREQVIAVMEQRYPANGPRQRPKIMDDTSTRLGFFMNPETSREPNCEGIFVTLENGKVAEIIYSRD